MRKTSAMIGTAIVVFALGASAMAGSSSPSKIERHTGPPPVYSTDPNLKAPFPLGPEPTTPAPKFQPAATDKVVILHKGDDFAAKLSTQINSTDPHAGDPVK